MAGQTRHRGPVLDAWVDAAGRDIVLYALNEPRNDRGYVAVVRGAGNAREWQVVFEREGGDLVSRRMATPTPPSSAHRRSVRGWRKWL